LSKSIKPFVAGARTDRACFLRSGYRQCDTRMYVTTRHQSRAQPKCPIQPNQLCCSASGPRPPAQT
jgi:hypothetical protein